MTPSGTRLVEYDCPSCGTVHECDVDEVGQRRCRDCGAALTVTGGGRR